jgi:cell division protein FtsI/penicillin-binding protein 2
MQTRKCAFVFLCLLALLTFPLEAAKRKTTAAPSKTSSSVAVREAAQKKTPRKRVRRARVVSPWTEPTFADSTAGDSVDGEDLVVRLAAVEALGPYNGSVVVVDPATGRILTMVNQKLILKSGFQPCSTIKIPVALAALMEGLIERNTLIRVGGRRRMNLVEAMARSDNPFFAALGLKLGFDRLLYYARLFGLGEPAGLNIEGEQPGVLPETPPPGGVGMMASFGEGISMTPLQLAALLSAIANGGTLYYLQYPRSQEEADNLVPRVKRHLHIGPWLNDIKEGLMAAVEYGTARRAAYDPSEPVLGKTGTCTENRVHLGWFGSFNDVGHNKLTVVVLLTGGRGVSGPTAAEIAGNVYRRLSEKNFFAVARPISPAALISTQSCCIR